VCGSTVFEGFCKGATLAFKKRQVLAPPPYLAGRQRSRSGRSRASRGATSPIIDWAVLSRSIARGRSIPETAQGR
jgi:hypothetical protein